MGNTIVLKSENGITKIHFKCIIKYCQCVNDANLENNCFELTGNVQGKGVEGTKVDFDLSVAAEQSNEHGLEKGGGLKIQIFSAGINAQEKDILKNQSLQKIQFAVFINDSKIKK